MCLVSPLSLTLLPLIFCANTMLGQALIADKASQQSALIDSNLKTETAAAPVSGNVDANSSPAETAVPAQSTNEALFHRWLDVKTLSQAHRWRSTAHSGGAHFFENGQERSVASGKIRLDAEGRYTIGFRASSGHYFNWAFADVYGSSFTTLISNKPYLRTTYTNKEWAERTRAAAVDPGGAHIVRELESGGWQMYLRELYFSATPVDWMTLEYGSFGIERGFSSEITSFDDDGYITGERIRIRDARHLYFDEVGYTNAFFGGIGTPNLLERGNSFSPTNTNYRQVFARKQLNAHVGFSGEYTWQLGTDALREAIEVDTRESKLVDKLHVEAYQRTNTVNLQGLNVRGGAGYAVILDKKAGKRLIGSVGFADIDKDNTVYSHSRYFHSVGFALNGDAYGLGKHPFVRANYKLTPYVSAFGAYSRVVGEYITTYNKETVTGGLEVNLKAVANSFKPIF